MQHIRTHDFFYRVLVMFAVLLHCYNPCVNDVSANAEAETAPAIYFQKRTNLF